MAGKRERLIRVDIEALDGVAGENGQTKTPCNEY